MINEAALIAAESDGAERGLATEALPGRLEVTLGYYDDGKTRTI